MYKPVFYWLYHKAASQLLQAFENSLPPQMPEYCCLIFCYTLSTPQLLTPQTWCTENSLMTGKEQETSMRHLWIALLLLVTACTPTNLNLFPTSSPMVPAPFITLTQSAPGIVTGFFPPFRMDLWTSGRICIWMQLVDIWNPKQNPPVWSDLPEVTINLDDQLVKVEETSYTSSAPMTVGPGSPVKYPGNGTYCATVNLTKGIHSISVRVLATPGVATIYSWRFAR